MGQGARDTGFVGRKEEEESWKKQVKKRSGRGNAGKQEREREPLEARRGGEGGREKGREREREKGQGEAGSGEGRERVNG